MEEIVWLPNACVVDVGRQVEVPREEVHDILSTPKVSVKAENLAHIRKEK